MFVVICDLVLYLIKNWIVFVVVLIVFIVVEFVMVELMLYEIVILGKFFRLIFILVVLLIFLRIWVI